MKLSRFYDLVVSFGKDRDVRPSHSVDLFEDSRVLYGDPDTEVKKILVGIDIEVADLLLADRVRQRQGLDLVVSHHPEGIAYASLHKVMRLQIDVLKKSGLKEGVARKLLEERMLEVQRKIMPQNHTRPVDAAVLLNLPFMCMHTPADNHVYSYLTDLMNKEKPELVGDILDILLSIPEYKDAQNNLTGPHIVVGSPKRKAGKILVDMTGGTEGPKEVFDKLYKAGVRTLICMHLSEEHFKKAKEANLSAVIAGHISSDTLGLNLLLDRIEKEEPLQITSCSGFKRIKRN